MTTATTPRPLCGRFSGRRFATITLVFVALAAATPAQLPVNYGEPARAGNITAPLVTHRFILLNAQQGDTLRVTFSSQSCCNPTYYYHELDVSFGATSLGNIQGVGVRDFAIPSTGTYTISVKARNNQSTGWYAFKLNRLNDPVGADRIAFGWNMPGSIDAAAEFDVYTLHATMDGSGVLRFTSQSCCNPTYYYHYAELVDATGQRQAIVNGNGAAPFTIQADGVYTLFVAARNFQSTGWYAVSVECASWPAVPCDCVAYSANYGEGWPGTNDVPTLTASARPILGAIAGIDIGNCLGQPTQAFVLLGTQPANQATAFGGTLLVAAPTVLPPIALPVAGGRLPYALPNDPLLCGIGFVAQALVLDPGASAELAFSRGLSLIVGR